MQQEESKQDQAMDQSHPFTDLSAQLFTLEQYKTCMEAEVQYADPTDLNDPNYFRKHASSHPPFDSHFVIPSKYDLVNTEKDKNARIIFYGWNNLSQFEALSLDDIRKCMQDELNYPVPDGFDERDVLKFAQAYEFNTKKAANALVEHLKWRASLPKNLLSNNVMRMVQSGMFYIFGRDKFYRPTMVVDYARVAEVMVNEPELLNEQTCLETLMFYYEYLVKVLFLPGQVETCSVICNVADLSIKSLPRELILSTGRFVQYNIMYHMQNAYFLEVGFGMRMFYKAISWMIHPETRAKYVITGVRDPPQLKEMYHPSQLEKRFGGQAETPARFWPPTFGAEFLPNPQDRSHLSTIKHEDYEQTLSKNPSLIRHPEYLSEEFKVSRDFIVPQEEEQQLSQEENGPQESVVVEEEMRQEEHVSQKGERAGENDANLNSDEKSEDDPQGVSLEMEKVLEQRYKEEVKPIRSRQAANKGAKGCCQCILF